MRSLVLTAIAVAVIAANSSPASANVITFEDITPSGFKELSSGALVGGLQFFVTANQYVVSNTYPNPYASNGTDYYITNGELGGSISKYNGTFYLNSFDVGRADYTSSDFSVTFTFMYAAGGSSTETYTNTAPYFVTYAFNLPELSSIEIASTHGYVAIDNINYTVATGSPGGYGGIPEPETWVMMTLGLGLLGAALRRRNPMDAAATH